MDIPDNATESESSRVDIDEDSRENIETLLRESGISPEQFYLNFEFMERVFMLLVEKTGVGFHILKTSMNESMSIFIVKTGDRQTKTSEDISPFITHTAMNLTVRGGFGMEMRSFLNGGSDESKTIHAGVPQELRGWIVRPNSLEPLTSQQCIDTHCIDLVTGKFLEPELNVSYRSGWLFIDDAGEDFMPLT
jgi:hypothetical protein